MQKQILIYMVIKNACKREALVREVVTQAAKISPRFYVVDHTSADDTRGLFEDLKSQLSLELELVNEDLAGTMDDVKAKHYKILKQRFWNAVSRGVDKNYIFIIDWDEVVSDELANEINRMDLSQSEAYLINRHTYFLKTPIDRNAHLPLLFETDGVEINTFSKFHNLYKIHTNSTKKLKWVLHHYSYESIDDIFSKNKYYASGEAEELYKNNPNITGFQAILRFLWEWTMYFGYTLTHHSNFTNAAGWLYSLNWYVYKFYKYVFYMEYKINAWK